MQKEVEKIILEASKVLSGKKDVIRRILTAALSDGHILLDDVPGVGKTTLAVALGRISGLSYGRVQFTPDVLPSDLTGFSVYNKDSGALEYRPGILTQVNLLLGDEINRTSSKTQSALLEAMEEKQVTVDGSTYPLKTPFIVIATQNNVGTAGTQLLPYAQMDRFMVRLSIGYPDKEAQMDLLKRRQNQDPLADVEQVLEPGRFAAMQSEVSAVYAADSILDYITRLSIASRQAEELEVGISPRGALCIDRMAKCCAYIEGRDYVLPEDVRTVMHDVCDHRIILTQKARLGGLKASGSVDRLLSSVTVPDRMK